MSEYLVSGSHRKLSDNYTVLMQPAQLGERRPRKPSVLRFFPNPFHPAQVPLLEEKRNVKFQKFFFLFFFQCVCFFFSQRAECDITLRLISSAPSVQGGKTSRNLWRLEFPVDLYPDGAEFFWVFFPSEEEKASACGNVVSKTARMRCGGGLEDVYRHRGKWRN